MSQRLVSKYVKETHIKTYSNEDFKGYGDIELGQLNIRDILVYDEFPFYLEDHSKVQLYNVLISCYDNGLISFQISANIKNNSTQMELQDPIFTLVDCEPITFTGSIFFEKDFKLKPFKQIYMVLSTPFSVTEVSLANNNMKISRIYALTKQDNSQVVGTDLLSVNENFIAAVLFDYNLSEYIVRIFRRKVQNNEIGFFNIPISNFGPDVLSINFMCDDICNKLFMRTAHVGILYEIYNKELVFETWIEKSESFDELLNKNIALQINAQNSILHSGKYNFTIYARFVEKNDTTTYLIKSNNIVNSWHEYGDKGFKFLISDYYSGPMMELKAEFNSSNLYNEVLMPNVSQTFIVKEQKDTGIKQECQFSFVHRYITEHNHVELNSFYCIHEKQIVQVKINNSKIQDSIYSKNDNKYFDYPREKFIAGFFYDTDNSEYETIDKLILVSENIYSRPKTYTLN